MSKVYVIQRHMTWNDQKGELEDRYDLSPAEEYGRLVYLLPPAASPFKSRTVLAHLHRRLAKFTEDDYLLLVGNPCLIGFAAIVAAQKTGGSVRFLQWHGRERKYLEVQGSCYGGRSVE